MRHLATTTFVWVKPRLEASQFIENSEQEEKIRGVQVSKWCLSPLNKTSFSMTGR